MKVEDILKLSRREALTKYVNELDAAYYELSGRHFCRVCPSDISTMLNELKQKYTMDNNNFKLIRERASYRVHKGVYISNDKMSDELAVEWLKQCPERIKFFSSAPENWEELIGLKEAKVDSEDDVIDVPEEDIQEASDESQKDKFNKMKLNDLKAEFPTIPVEFGQKKAEFIDKIILHLEDIKK